jgi:hypothetical protein
VFKIYYHATNSENVKSILTHGIRPILNGQHSPEGGQVYCSSNPDAAVRWICLTRPMWAKVTLIPFVGNPEDMRLGIDHSPKLTEMLGVSDDGAAYVTGHVEPDRFIRQGIQEFDNPFHAGGEDE